MITVTRREGIKIRALPTPKPIAVNTEELTHLWWTWRLSSSLALYLSLEHKKASWPTSAVKEIHSINCHHQTLESNTGILSSKTVNYVPWGRDRSQKRILWESNPRRVLDQTSGRASQEPTVKTATVKFCLLLLIRHVILGKLFYFTEC